MEVMSLILKYRKNSIVFKRHIDDIFIIWRIQGEYDDGFNEFKRTLNNTSNLDWECEELSETVTFLDLDITINRKSKRFECKTHLEKQALASCMPPHSAHPPNAARGMVFSLLKKLKCE